MKRKDWMVIALILLSITFLMIYDFFPMLNDFLYIPKIIVTGFMLLILFLSFLVTRSQNQKSALIWQISSVSYLLVLIIVFSLFGGVSQVGISPSNPVFWIVLVISVIEIIREYKKLKMENQVS